jgi:peroxiredoxin Q/BCP
MTLNTGDKVPQFSIEDESGNLITSDDLLGNTTVMYFYPKDDTPGCTKEACDFRDNMHSLEGLGVMVLGVSHDGAESHRKFADKYSLNFSLLPDTDKRISRAFCTLAANGKESMIRSTFIIDAHGIVRWKEQPVAVEGHVERVMKAVSKIHAN